MTDQQALERYATHRDAEAFRQLVLQYQRLVYYAARRRLQQPNDVDDAVQLTFLKLARSAATVRRDLASWLYATTIHTANDLLRRKQARRHHEELAASCVKEENDVQREVWAALSASVDE